MYHKEIFITDREDTLQPYLKHKDIAYLSTLTNTVAHSTLNARCIYTLHGLDQFNVQSIASNTCVEISTTLSELISRVLEVYKKITIYINNDYFAHELQDLLYYPISANTKISFINNRTFEYKRIEPKKILDSIRHIQYPMDVIIKNVRFTVFPGVYPSNRFRSSRELLKFTKSKIVRGKHVADIGCAHGIMGINAILNGALTCHFIDINPDAIASTKHNIIANHVIDKSYVDKSNLFNNIHLPIQKYDIIYFNPPFHLEKTTDHLSKCLMLNNENSIVIADFWPKVKHYIHQKSIIYLAFSNKDVNALRLLERSMTKNGYLFKLLVHKYRKTHSDVRIYKVIQKLQNPAE
jgi:16S rRNA G1207 methylase RsmC